MGGIYAQYCIHGSPIYHTKYCSGCRRVKEAQAKKRYDAYWDKHRGDFWEYFKKSFGYDASDPTEKHVVPQEFSSMKRSTSQEELKKAYHKLARKHHPDKKGGSTNMFQRLQNLYERLLFQFSI